MRHRPSFLYGGLVWATVLLLLIFNAVLPGYNLASIRQSILLNQVGYLPQAPKVALLVNLSEENDDQARLIDLSDGSIVATVSPSPPITDPASEETIQALDFSNIDQSGNYLWSYGSLQSEPFAIKETVFADTLTVLLRSYYLQRCGVALSDPETGLYHPPCHLNDGVVAHSDSVHAANDKIAAVGGWHDAGDYGKYVSTTAITVGRLLNVYEQFPQHFWDEQLNIPESGNGIPDLLDEMKFGLDWMLHMQRSDGAVYRKLSGEAWPIGLSPEEDTQPRYVYGISTPETAKFAGAMAMAARLYQPFDGDLSDRYLAAATKAWQFLTHQPDMQVDEYPGDNSGSGAYLFSEWDQEETLLTDVDDRLWAASELFLSTSEDTYERYFADQFETFDYGLFEWKDPSALGMLDYLLQAETVNSEGMQIKERLKTKLLERADRLLEVTDGNSYGLANSRFIWGSNKMVAEEGITLFYAYKLTGNVAYQKAAFAQLDYLLGRNPFNQTFITAVGTHFVQNVHHTFGRAHNRLIPGLMVGGPNSDAQDGIAPPGLGIRSYLDSVESYATNEYAIDYNASVIGLMALLEADSSGDRS